MCGISGIYLKNPDASYLNEKEKESLVDWLYCGIEHRGTHATGIAVQDKNGETVLEKSDMPASKFIFWRRDLMPDARTILMHTRLYTKGKPENLLNNHPVQYDNIMMVHNGHISNDDELFENENLERFAEVDSEIIPALLHKYGMLEPKEALEKMSGGFAIAAIDQNNPGKLLLAKGSTSPLIYLETDSMWIWASEENAIKDALEFGLNIENAKKLDYKVMQYGEYILIDGEKSEKDNFKPYHKPYSSKYPASVGAHNPNQYHGSYTSAWDKTDVCDECFQPFDLYKMNRIGQNYYCDKCDAKLFDITENGVRIAKASSTTGKKLSRKERKRLRREAQLRFQESQKMEEPKDKKEKEVVSSSKVGNKAKDRISEVLDEEHWFVCELVAEYYGTKSEFVDMILFSDELLDEDDPMLATIYMEFDDKYNEFLDDIRDETDVVLNRISDTTKKARSFPVGF
jgi:hypothetical protein